MSLLGSKDKEPNTQPTVSDATEGQEQALENKGSLPSPLGVLTTHIDLSRYVYSFSSWVAC